MGQVVSKHGAVAWYVKDHIIRAEVAGDWTDGSAQFFNQEFLDKIAESRAEQVFVIFDTTQMKQVLVSPNATVRYLNYLRDERMGLAVLYGIPMPQRAIVGLLANVLNAAFATKVDLAKTEAEALEKVIAISPNIPMSA